MLEIVAVVTPQAVWDAPRTHVPLWGMLFLRFPDCAFPGDGWTDAINVCVPKWLADARTLTYGLVDEIREEFMDEAPRFTFRVRLMQPEQARLTCYEWNRPVADPLELPLHTYTAALATAGRALIHQLEPMTGSIYPLLEELKRSVAFFTA
jgi:hypothetical protein